MGRIPRFQIPQAEPRHPLHRKQPHWVRAQAIQVPSREHRSVLALQSVPARLSTAQPCSSLQGDTRETDNSTVEVHPLSTPHPWNRITPIIFRVQRQRSCLARETIMVVVVMVALEGMESEARVQRRTRVSSGRVREVVEGVVDRVDGNRSVRRSWRRIHWVGTDRDGRELKQQGE